MNSAMLAEELGLSPKTIWLMSKNGKIPFSLTPGGHRRYNLREVQAALEGRTHSPERIRVGDARKRHLVRNTAEQAAFRLLARRHPAEFAELLKTELDFRGYEEPVLERPCECGGTIVRRSTYGPWPRQCAVCDPKRARGREYAARAQKRKKARLLAITRYDPSKMRAS